jgi:hypothetical protein
MTAEENMTPLGRLCLEQMQVGRRLLQIIQSGLISPEETTVYMEFVRYVDEISGRIAAGEELTDHDHRVLREYKRELRAETSPDVSTDQREAESRRYSNAAFFVLPLESGRIAVLTPRRELFRVVEDWAEAMAVGTLAAGEPERKLPKFPGIDVSDLL